MRRVRFVPAALALCCLAATLAGCDTTRDKSTRAQIFAVRSLDARRAVVVKRDFRPITVEQVQAVGRGRAALIVVRLRNSSAQTYAALPVNVRAGRKILNRGPEIAFFSNHVPAIGAGAVTTWIYRSNKRIPSGRLSARVGRPDPELSTGTALPDLTAEHVLVSGGRVRGEVKNDSGTPQYSVEIYASTRSRGRYTSAATGRIVKLSSKGTRRFALALVGKPGGSKPKVMLGPAILAKHP
jgi:hypothetical protein